MSSNSVNEEATIHITRPVYTYESFDKNFNVHNEKISEKWTRQSVVDRLRSVFSSRCNGRYLQRLLLDHVPVIDHLRRYRWKKDLPLDVIAGLSGGVIHVPQGMGFALLAGLPPIYGLYTSFFPGLLYYIFGTSKHLSIGSMALTSMMVGTVVTRELPLIRDANNLHVSDVTTTASYYSTFHSSTNYSKDSFLSSNTTSSTATDAADVAIKVSLAVSVTLFTGIFQLAMQICRLGVLTTYMSVPFSSSFMVGAALQIMVSQLPFMLGISIQRPPAMFQLPITLYEVFRNIAKANPCAVITSIICIVFLIGIKEGVNERYKKKLKCPIPVELIVVIVATIISHFAQLNARYKLPITGVIPSGFPKPTAPSFPNLTNYLADAVALAVIGFAVAMTMAQLMARRFQYQINTNQEILAYGIANTVSSFFGCFVSTQAPPRTMVHAEAGGRTQMAGCLSVILPLLVILWIGPLFQSLPTSVLGAIVACCLVPLLKQFGDLRFLWKVNKYDFFVWSITFLSTSLISVTVGLAVGVGSSIFFIAVQAQLAKGFRMISAKNTEIYYCPSSGIYQSLERDFRGVGIYVFRYDCGEICFVNAVNFKRHLFREIDHKQKTESVSNGEVEIKIVEPLGDVKTLEQAEREPTTAAVIPAFDDMVSRNETTTRSNGSLERPLKDAGAVQDDTSNTELSVVDGESSAKQGKAVCIWARPRRVILDLTSVCYIDITGLNTIKQISADYKLAGVKLALVIRNARLKLQMSVCGLIESSLKPDEDEERIKVYPTVHDAVVDALSASPAYAEDVTV